MSLHPLVEIAATGQIPSWSVAGPGRREHMARVADLLRSWARARALPSDEVARWAAAGHLHDVLRDADPAELRPMVPEELQDLADPLLHGPAAAARLAEEGVTDEGLLLAIAFHTLGHPDFDELGRFLYLADFLEVGRRHRHEWRAALRKRLPADPGSVLEEVAEARLGLIISRRQALRDETVRFWNRTVEAAR